MSLSKNKVDMVQVVSFVMSSFCHLECWITHISGLAASVWHHFERKYPGSSAADLHKKKWAAHKYQLMFSWLQCNEGNLKKVKVTLQGVCVCWYLKLSEQDSDFSTDNSANEFLVVVDKSSTCCVWTHGNVLVLYRYRTKLSASRHINMRRT